MAWTDVKTWRPGSSVTSTDLDVYLSANMTEANRQTIIFRTTGTLTTSTAAGLDLFPGRFRSPFPFTIDYITIATSGGSTSGSVIFDILKSTDDNVSTTSTKFTTLFTSSSKFITLTSGAIASPLLSTNGTDIRTTVFTPDVTSVSSGDVLVMRLVNTGSTSVGPVSITIAASGA